MDRRGGRRGRGVVAVDDVGRVGGFVSPDRHETVFLADPALTDPLVDELLPWLREQRDVVQLLASGADTARVTALQRHGLRYCRSSFTLARPIAPGRCLRPRFPTGACRAIPPRGLRRLRPPAHLRDAAWASVAGHAERDLDGWSELTRPCRSLFLADRDRRPVGWVAGRLLDSGREYGSSLADRRSRSLARRALLLAHSGSARSSRNGRAAVLYDDGSLVKVVSKVSSKNQVTIPVGVLRAAGIAAGDDVIIRAAGSGRIEVERADDLVARFAGSLPAGTYPEGYLDELRDEWRR